MSDLLTPLSSKPKSAAATTGEVMAVLRERYCAPEFSFFEEVGDSGSGSRVYADGVAINMWASRGYAITGFEVKASRSDWLRELKQPEKAEPILTKCDYWYLVAPDEVYLPDEVPVSWGILSFKDGKLREKRKAPKLEPRAITRAFVAQMFRRGHTREQNEIKHLIDKALADERAAMQRRINEAADNRTRELREMSNKWKHLVEKIGDHEWSDADDIVKAVKVVRSSGIIETYGGLNKILDSLKFAVKRLEDSCALIQEPEPIEPLTRQQVEKP